jgi:integral membrane sensor domain MASE1
LFQRVAEILGLAVAYFVLGRLGTLTAIPPGVATAIWPPSGLAIAALPVRGQRLWPGIALGSALLNTGILHGSGVALAQSFLVTWHDPTMIWSALRTWLRTISRNLCAR